MNVLVDIGHPAHVHLFKNLIFNLSKNKHKVIVTGKDIPDAERLLNIYKIPCVSLGSKSDSIKGKFLNQFKYDWLMYKTVKREKIHFAVGSSITIAHVSKITRTKSFIFDDDDSSVEPLFAKFGHPFADYIVTPECLAHENYGNKHLTYAGFHELAYLHPNQFQPNPGILDELGIKKKEPYFVMRFNVFKAHHDVGAKGLSLEQKRKLVQFLSERGKVFITTEREIEEEFSGYQLRLSPEKIHSLLYYTTMFIGDSQTMTSEAALLGTPAIRCNSFVGKISYLEEQEHRYGLTYGFTPENGDEMIGKVKQLLNTQNLKEEWEKRRQKLLSDKIDVTTFMVWLIENYPDSVKIMKETPDYQLKFR